MTHPAYHLTIFGVPKGKPRPRFVGWHTYSPSTAYELELGTEFRRQNPGAEPMPKGVPVKVDVIAFFPIPQRATKAQRDGMRSGQILPTRKPDADNILKLVLDALNGMAWHDDAQVVDVSCKKLYGAEGMTCISIAPVEWRGPSEENTNEGEKTHELCIIK